MCFGGEKSGTTGTDFRMAGLSAKLWDVRGFTGFTGFTGQLATLTTVTDVLVYVRVVHS